MILEGIFKKAVSKLFGDKQSRDMKRYLPKVEQINEIYSGMASLSDEQLRAKTDEFRARLAAGETLDDVVHEAFAVVKEACRRHCGQTDIVCGKPLMWNMVPYDVQLIAGLALFEGNIAEQQTGEGKTLTAVLPLYTHALTGKGAHLITVNDYLAKRDCEWNKPIFEFLGLTVDCIDYSEPHTPERRKAYLGDIVYGTNNEFGFDYLRDNMTPHRDALVQRELYFGIVDEVDSILIDEARTPLIISGAVERPTDQYDKIKPMVERLVRKQVELINEFVANAQKTFEATEKGNRDSEWEVGRLLLLARKGAPKHKRLMKVTADSPVVERYIGRVEREFMIEKKIHELEADLYYVIDEKGHNIDLTEKGRQMLAPTNPDMFVLHDLVEAFSEIEGNENLTPEQKEEGKRKARIANETRADELHNIAQLLRAFSLYEKDVEYVVEDNKVIIVDENTGRKMPGRRWSDGLHQAVEAKESVRVEAETQTLATVTVQNFFRMYKRLAGMTGTAETEAAEFFHTYKMDVVVVPPNVTTRRTDFNDYIYRTKREKYNAVIDEIIFYHKARLPVLVGTVSVEVSELLSRMLRRTGISHNVLNAKNHQREADIIADAGKPGQVTIATNMAGRGTDIKLQPAEDMMSGEKDVKGLPIIEVTAEDEDGKPHQDKIPYGLQIIGSERHEARRIDRQLRGRSGRQGDAGSSQFFMALEDDLMRLF
ncbi:MAG: preprotein translocase subunit SecA, partial [Candidatus Sumerlaeota bacterium]|nr:preprotein translocase subunit SecA [Candidatus Sumerlaeota bacterium]